MKLQRDEFLARYGDLWVAFKSYYKYRFTYSVTLGTGNTLVVSTGGDASTIYRFKLDAHMRVRDVDPDVGSLMAPDGTCLEEWFAENP